MVVGAIRGKPLVVGARASFGEAILAERINV
jgi:hypothetical protein